MQLPRREPREVYRVYGAEEFLAGADAEDGLASTLAQDADSRNLRPRSGGAGREKAIRSASAAILIAGVGAACGLIVARNMPVAGRRIQQRAGGLHAVAGSQGAPAIAAASPQPTRRAAQPSVHQVRSAPGRVRRGPHSSVTPPPAIESAASPRVTLAAAGRSEAAPEPPVPVEFGFER
jgi:hypothetical protein